MPIIEGVRGMTLRQLLDHRDLQAAHDRQELRETAKEGALKLKSLAEAQGWGLGREANRAGAWKMIRQVVRNSLEDGVQAYDAVRKPLVRRLCEQAPLLPQDRQGAGGSMPLRVHSVRWMAQVVDHGLELAEVHRVSPVIATAFVAGVERLPSKAERMIALAVTPQALTLMHQDSKLPADDAVKLALARAKSGMRMATSPPTHLRAAAPLLEGKSDEAWLASPLGRPQPREGAAAQRVVRPLDFSSPSRVAPAKAHPDAQ